MHQSKLIQILGRFTKEEIRQFESFLESPYFNTSKKLLAFYRLLIIHHPDFDSPKLEKEKIYRKLHGKSVYNDQTMRELISGIFKLSKEFISYQQLKKNPIEAANKRYLWFVENRLNKISEQELVHCDELLLRYEQKDYDYYYQRWVTDYNEYFYLADVLRDREHKLFKQKEFGHHLHSLNKFYLMRFLESYVYLMNMAKIYNMPLDPRTAGHIGKLGAGYVGKGDILIDIYYNIYSLLSTGDEKYYYELKAIFLSGTSTLDRPVLTELSINLENYCVQRMREGDKQFAYEIMEVFHFVVERELMIDKGEVSYIFYKNVITIGVDNGETPWLRVFAEKYKPYLPANCREEAYNFGMAYILLAERKFEEALRITTELGAWNDFGKLDVKTLTSRIHYELGMFEQLYISLDSYAHHLNRDTINISRKENHLHFIEFMKKLISLRQGYTHSAWEKLMIEIKQTSAFTNKSWFQEKMIEMHEIHTNGGSTVKKPSEADILAAG